MVYKFDVSVNELMGMPRVYASNAASIWRKLTQHALEGNCTCHMIGTHAHVLEGCETGKWLAEEYTLTVNMLKEKLK